MPTTPFLQLASYLVWTSDNIIGTITCSVLQKQDRLLALFSRINKALSRRIVISKAMSTLIPPNPTW